MKFFQTFLLVSPILVTNILAAPTNGALELRVEKLSTRSPIPMLDADDEYAKPDREETKRRSAMLDADDDYAKPDREETRRRSAMLDADDDYAKPDREETKRRSVT